jgi:hypothetical protein
MLGQTAEDGIVMLGRDCNARTIAQMFLWKVVIGDP